MHEHGLDPDPLREFARWYEGVEDDAVCLATTSETGVPSARMVLLKGFNERGFRFFTNLGSRKAHELGRNPRAALVFYWPPGRQVRVEGHVTALSQEETADYWATRPRGSQLGAWVSHQSEVIENRQVLEDSLDDARTRFEGDEVPCPPFWGGFLLRPESIEFWVHREDRLHDRLRYRRVTDRWVLERLAP